MVIILLAGRFDRYFCATLKIAEGLVEQWRSRGKNVLYVYTFLLFALDGVHHDQLEQCE